MRRPLRWTASALAAAALGVPAAWAQGEAAAVEPAHVIVTEPGDTLIGLGRRWLVDPSAWREIARANGLRDPDRIGTGRELRIPLRLLRTEAVPATVLAVTGAASDAGAAPLQPGQALPEGSVLRTGADGHVTLRLVDGTVLRLRPSSQLKLDESRRIRDTPATRAGARLEQGRVEVDAAPAPAGRPGFRIQTPQGVLGVRGTEFRVAAEPGAAGAQAATRGEVLGGVVAVDGRGGSPGQRVGAGFGTVVDAAGRVAPPVALLPAPDLRALPARQEQVLVRFALPALAGAAAWRGQVAPAAAPGFDRVLADTRTDGAELRIAGLPDGEYLLRLRAIDAQGLEGRDADHRFSLKARPEAPLPQRPDPDAVLFGDRVAFAWAANPDAARYRLQLATDEAFASPVRDVADLTGLALELAGLPPGRYFWRLASVRDTAAQRGDQGPWGAARSFTLRPPPPAPAPPAVDGQTVRFSWPGLPGQRFEFEVARDAGFTERVLLQPLAEPAIALPLPGSGRFHVRLRAIEADGFVGPWSTPQFFDVPECLRDASGACVRAADRPLNLVR